MTHPSSADHDDTFVMLGRHFTLNGDIRGEGTIVVRGQVIGNIRTQKLIVGQDSHIQGNIQCSQLDITGTIDGNVDANDIVVRAGAKVDGVVTYRTFAMEQGGVVDARMIKKASTTESLEGNDAPARPMPAPAANGSDTLLFTFTPEIQKYLQDGASFSLPGGETLPQWMVVDAQKNGISMDAQALKASGLVTDNKVLLVLMVNGNRYEVQLSLIGQ